MRALTRNPAISWYEGYDPVVSLAQVAVCFDCSADFIRRVMREETELLTQPEAAKYLKLPIRTFRHRYYRPAMQLGNKIRRYTKKQLDNRTR